MDVDEVEETEMTASGCCYDDYCWTLSSLRPEIHPPVHDPRAGFVGQEPEVVYLPW